MRRFISVVLLGVLGGCASQDSGYDRVYERGPVYGPAYGPVYAPDYGPGYRYREFPNSYRIERREVHVPVYRTYEPHRQPVHRQEHRHPQPHAGHHPSHRNPEPTGRRVGPSRRVDLETPHLAPERRREQRSGDGHWRGGRDGGQQSRPSRQSHNESRHRGQGEGRGR